MEARRQSCSGAAAEGRIAAKLVARPAPSARSSRPASVVPLAGRIARYATPLALAAAVVLFIATHTGDGDGPELPGYGVVAVGEQAMRGEPTPGSRLRIGQGAGSRFEILGRPSSAVSDGTVVAYAFAMTGGRATPLEADVEVSKDGAVRVRGEARDLAGSSEIRVVVGTPESIGKFEGAVARAQDGSSDARVKVLIVAVER